MFVIIQYFKRYFFPAQRKGRDVDHSTIDPTTLSALVMPDLCYVRDALDRDESSPTISIEIKVSLFSCSQ